MNDEEYFGQLCSNSVDGTLTDSEREKLEAHLAECPSCAALLRDLREMRALFAQEAEAPDSLHDGIMEQLRQETKLHVVQPEKPVRRMPVFTMVACRGGRARCTRRRSDAVVQHGRKRQLRCVGRRR